MSKPYTFIDLFAGIGGFHLALHAAGAQCVFASEMNPHARATYLKNFGPLLAPEHFAGDIHKVAIDSIPSFDILAAGFPCQAFSYAGKRKGFDDVRGTLFFHIAKILQERTPSAFFLENVRGLLSHDGGKTFATIQSTLTQTLGYSLHFKVFRASDFGLPQHRARLYMVGFKDPATAFCFPAPTGKSLTMSAVFGGKCNKDIGFTLRVGGAGSGLGDRRNWDTYLVDGQERRLTVEDAKKMQGFPASFTFPVSVRQSFKQLGNSVAVPVVQAIATQILTSLSQASQVAQGTQSSHCTLPHP